MEKIITSSEVNKKQKMKERKTLLLVTNNKIQIEVRFLTEP